MGGAATTDAAIEDTVLFIPGAARFDHGGTRNTFTIYFNKLQAHSYGDRHGRAHRPNGVHGVLGGGGAGRRPLVREIPLEGTHGDGQGELRVHEKSTEHEATAKGDEGCNPQGVRGAALNA
jgi:hypothetical protein